MSEHKANVKWERRAAQFVDGRYSRVHAWRFDGGAEVRASASPEIVRAPMSDRAAVDPEEAFVAALASCHMLWFLSIAAEKGFVVDTYEDDAAGFMRPLADGRQALGRIVLRPAVRFTDAKACSREELAQLHAMAHHQCFLANALSAELVVEPVST